VSRATAFAGDLALLGAVHRRKSTIFFAHTSSLTETRLSKKAAKNVIGDLLIFLSPGGFRWGGRATQAQKIPPAVAS
jgi:hypothetical protein